MVEGSSGVYTFKPFGKLSEENGLWRTAKDVGEVVGEESSGVGVRSGFGEGLVFGSPGTETGNPKTETPSVVHFAVGLRRWKIEKERRNYFMMKE